MVAVNYTQSNFTRGEIDPLLGARFDYDGYGKFLQKARNCLTLPQGPITKRFGTKFIDGGANYSGVAEESGIDFVPFLYNNIATYLYVFIDSNIFVYLEDTLVFTITSTSYKASDIPDIRFSQVEERIIVTSPNYAPANIIGPTGSPVSISAVNTSTGVLTLGTAVLTTGNIFPVTFATSGSLPTSSPQIQANRTYFGVALSATTFQVYLNVSEADSGVQPIQFSAAGSSSTATPLITFTLSNISFTNYPTYDFGNYNYYGAAFTFTPTSTTPVNIGASITFTGSSSIFDNGLVGGVFTSSGGVVRIVSTSSSTITGILVAQFAQTNAGLYYATYSGPLSFLGQPAWGASVGWPRCSTFFQNRLWLAGTPAIPNGVWGSVVNEAVNFDDSENFDDNAISYYPASGNLSFVQSMTSTRSLLIHTSTGTYSTPLTTDFPITPSTVSFVEQNKDGVSAFQPIVIDNQVVFVDSSQNNVKNLIWEFAQSAYVLRNISITSSSLIRKPTDIANYSNPLVIDGSYAFLTNDDGTLACFQTLYTEDVAGWTLATTGQQISSSGANGAVNQFAHVCSSLDRVWFITVRGSLSPVGYLSMTQITNNSIVMTNSYITAGRGIGPNGSVYFIQFSSPYPVSSPQINGTQYYFANVTNYGASNVITFNVYSTADDATAQVNPITLRGLSAGQVQFSLIVQTFNLEELDFDAEFDCTTYFNNNAGELTGLDAYNGAYVGVVADGYVFAPQQVCNGTLTYDPNGNTYSNVQAGYGFTMEVQTLPVNNLLTTGSNFYKTKTFRNFYLYYYNTIGAQINGVEFYVTPNSEYSLTFSAPPIPQTGIFQTPPMVGWDPLTQGITITQPNPLPLTILGYSMVVEIT